MASANKPPVYLIGCHRSGTTLLRFLLDAHPNIACPPETKFLAGLVEFVAYPQVASALQSLGTDGSLLFKDLRHLVCTVMGRFADSQGKGRWVDKTPNYCRLVDFINAVFCGKVQFVFVVRHPLDTIVSLQSMFGRVTQSDDPDIAPIVLSEPSGLARWARYWRDTNEALVQARDHFAERALLVRYEDVVSAPVAQLSRILRFIDEADIAEALVESALERQPVRGYEDPNIRFTRAIHTRSLARKYSLTESEVAELWALVEPIALHLDYTMPAAMGDRL